MAFGTRSIPVEVGGDGRFVVPAREFVPAYLATYESGRLREKVDEALEALRGCRLCPRDCEVDRLANRFAVCKSGRYARVSAAFHHFGEEDVLRGWIGSGTIFFDWCNLRCIFCQNWETSQKGGGEEVAPGRAGPAHAPAPGRGVSQHQFRHPGARGPTDLGGAAPGRGGRTPAPADLQHQRLRQRREPSAHARGCGRLHAGFQALGPRPEPTLPLGPGLSRRRARGHPPDARSGRGSSG